MVDDDDERTDRATFDLERFLPYLLNQAAEATSRSFQETYRAQYGLTRTQWRVLANLGKFGAMTARDICRISHMEKTKVSRAVSALERDGLVMRRSGETDRRTEILTLSEEGQRLFTELGRKAIEHDRRLRSRLGNGIADQFEKVLRRLIADAGDPRDAPDRRGGKGSD